MGDANTERATQYESWLTPKAAISLCASVRDNMAARTIYERLRLGTIIAIAREIHFEGKKTDYGQVPREVWRDLDHPVLQPFWQTGDLSSHILFHRERAQISCLGIRFDPVGIGAMDIAKSSAAAEAPPTTSEQIEEAPKGPPVSDADLGRWYQLYKSVYGPNTPEAHAIKSASGMFHDKSVGRARVRELRGAQKRGRKPTPDD